MTKTEYAIDKDEGLKEKCDAAEFGNVISLRLPVSLLDSMDESSEIVLPDKASDGERIAVIRRSGTQGKAEQNVSLQIEPVEQTDVYRSSSSSRTALTRVGSTSIRCTVQLASESKVRDLGRKARERLAEEKSKRREIVRLEGNPSVTNDSPIKEAAKEAKQGSTFSDAIRKTANATVPPIKRQRLASTKSRQVDSDERIDHWMPATSHLPVFPREALSNTVRLHGLPLGVSPEQIHQFFAGLEPELVYILPSYEATIPEWDAKPQRKKSLHPGSVERHSSSFRVFVKFHSVPLAEMATSRSGEIVNVEADNATPQGVCVAVSQVSKPHATHLLRNMAISALPGAPICDTLDETESKLAPGVTSFLWTMAIRNLELSTPKEEPNDMQYPWQEDSSVCNPADLAGYQKLAIHHNKLLTEYENLNCSETCLLTRVYDPELVQDAVVKLTSAASRCLLEEMERIQDRIREILPTWRSTS